MEPRTKREAEEKASAHEAMASACDKAAANVAAGAPVAVWRQWARSHRAEAARIRALLPTLPE